MKTTLHYLLTILLLSLTTVYARAAEGDEGPFKISDVNGVTPQYNEDKTLLTISGSGSLTITGDGKTINCGIVIVENAVALTFKDLHIETDAPLLVQGEGSTLILEGTNVLKGTATEPAIKNETQNFNIEGNGSLTLRGGENAPALTSTSNISKKENTILVAIDGKGTDSSELKNDGGLFLHGKVNDTDVIEQVSSELKGDLTIDHDFEIPAWASVNVARNQTLTIANDVTLINSGAIINTGTINGIPAGNPVNTIGGENGFTIESYQSVGLEYDSGKKLLTISGGGNLTIKGKGKSVDCGIVIATDMLAIVKMEDLYLESEIPLTAQNVENAQYPKIILQGINRLESNAVEKQPGMSLKGDVDISGPGSLTVKGSESGGAGIDRKECLSLLKNAFVVAIGGKGASGVEDNDNPIDIDGDNALLISGSLQNNGSIKQDDSKLIGNFTLNTNIEIPEWATVTIPANQSITITENGTLTNQGTLINQGTLTVEDKGTLTNQGTLTLEDNSTLTNQGTLILGENATFNKDKGTFINEKIIRIGGGLDISNVGPKVSWSYDNVDNLLTLDGEGSITITGKGKETPIDCRIVIVGGEHSNVELTIKDLYISKKENPFILEAGLADGKYQSLILQGTNIFEADTDTTGVISSAMVLKGNMNISGHGSLTVKGSKGGGAGIDCESYKLVIKDAVFRAEGGGGAFGIICAKDALKFEGDAFVVVIGGKGSENDNGISQANANINHENGLFICGRLNTDGSFEQDNSISELKGSIKLHVDAEIPARASISVNKGEEFTISDNVTLTNYGTLSNHGTIEIKEKGKIEGNPPEHYVKFEHNYNSPASAGGGYIKHGSEPIFEEFYPREGYTFEGWYDAPNGGRKVTAVTNPMTVYAHWTNNNPPPPPPPTVYYTVTLPAVEGAVTNPVAGTYLVESWGSFRFYLTIDTAYSESQPVVSTSRNETLTPQALDGAYVVEGVSTDMEIFIDGLVKNPPPVANESILTGDLPKIWVEHSCLCIRTPESAGTVPIRILTPSGHLLYSFGSVPGLNRRQLPTGIYIVRVGDTVEKVFVR